MQLIDGKKCEAGGPTAIGLPFSIPICMGKPSGPYGARLWGVCNTPLPCRSIVFIQMGRGATAYALSDVPDKGTNAVFGLCRWVIYWGASGPCRVRLWGVCNTPPPCRSIVFIQMGRAQQHTPHRTSPTRGRTSVPGCVDGAFVWVVWALPFICHGVGASPHRPPPPFLVLTQEKEAKEGQGYGHPS